MTGGGNWLVRASGAGTLAPVAVAIGVATSYLLLFVAFNGFGLAYSDNVTDPTVAGFAPTFTAVPGASGAAIVGG